MKSTYNELLKKGKNKDFRRFIVLSARINKLLKDLHNYSMYVFNELIMEWDYFENTTILIIDKELSDWIKTFTTICYRIKTILPLESNDSEEIEEYCGNFKDQVKSLLETAYYSFIKMYEEYDQYKENKVIASLYKFRKHLFDYYIFPAFMNAEAPKTNGDFNQYIEFTFGKIMGLLKLEIQFIQVCNSIYQNQKIYLTELYGLINWAINNKEKLTKFIDTEISSDLVDGVDLYKWEDIKFIFDLKELELVG